MRENLLINIFRLGFVGVLVLEVVSWKVLNESVDFTWQGLILTVILLFLGLEAVILWLKKRFGVSLSWISYAAAFSSLALDAAGDMYNLYSRFSPWYDKALHFWGGLVAAVIIYDILSSIHNSSPSSFSRSWIPFMVIFSAFFFGFVYEWLEYIEDVLYWKRPMRLGDAYDTMDDLQLDLLGSIAGVWISSFRKKPHAHIPHGNQPERVD